MANRQASATMEDLEDMIVNEGAKAKRVPLSLLVDITSDFSEENIIGHGAYAVVYKGSIRNRTIAVKRLKKLNLGLDLEAFKREIDCLMKVNHKNVVRFLGYCYETQGQISTYNGRSVIAQEEERLLCFQYLPNGSLNKYITDSSSCRREWRQCYQIINGVCQGLHRLHKDNILHLDLKPLNILLDDNMVPKIADFGLSRCLEENQSKVDTETPGGTLGYMAPELHKKGAAYTKKCDLFSLGVIIMKLLTGESTECTVDDVRERWIDRLEESKTNAQLDQIRVCAQLGIECSDHDPDKRPSDTNHIIDRLAEVESTQETQLSGNLLEVHPTMLVFDLQTEKLSPCSLKLTNNNDEHVAFKLNTTDTVDWSVHFMARLPLYGIVPARSSYTLILTVLERDKPQNRFCDMILQSCTSEYEYIWKFQDKPECEDFFNIKKAENVLNEVKLTATLSDKRQSISVTTGPGVRISSMEKPRTSLFSIDAHPTKPWIITGYECGRLAIRNHDTQKLLYSFKVSLGPVYSVKFIPRKQWFISSSAEGLVHVYSYETKMQKIKSFRAHSGPVSLAIHPTQPLVLSSPYRSGHHDKKLWDWDQRWECTQTFETEYSSRDFVCHVAFDQARNSNRFATASYNTVKVWSLDSPKPKYALPNWYFNGVTFLEFFTRDDQQYLIITGSYDVTADIWDMQQQKFLTKRQRDSLSLEPSDFSHPNLPILLTRSFDGTSRFWSPKDFRFEGVLDYGYGGDIRGITCLMGSKTRFLIGQEAALTILDIDNGEYHDSRQPSETQLCAATPGDASSEVRTQGSSELLHVHPLMLHFPFQAYKLISCSLYLTNNTDEHVAFLLSTEEQMEWWQHPFATMPLSGIVPPRSTYTLVVTMRALPNLETEQNFNLILQSSISGDRYMYTFTQESECDQFFDDAKETGNPVPKVKLRAVLSSLQGHTSENESTGQQENQPLVSIWGLFHPAKDYYNVLCSLDSDPRESWIITGHRNGDVSIWKCDTQRMISSINPWEETGHRQNIHNTQHDVYSAKFITRKQQFVARTYDGFIHVYSYGTRMERLHRFKAYSSAGIIDSDIYSSRSLVVHPTLPYVLTISGKMKLWDWDSDWKCIRIFKKEHSDSIRQVAFSPNDANTFASASSDHTVKLWSLSSPTSEYTLSGHWDKVNCLGFFTGTDGLQYLVSGSQDCTAKIWDLEKQECVHTMDGFMSPVVSVISLPDSPYITTGSEDGTVQLWSSASFRLERVLDIGWRAPVRSLCLMGSKRVVIEKMGEISIMDIIGTVSETSKLARPNKLIQVDPPVLRFPIIQRISSTLNIRNITDHHVAFSIWSLNHTSNYIALPDKGVIPPMSMLQVVLTRVAHKLPAQFTQDEVVFVKATVVPNGLRTTDITFAMFDETKTGQIVQLVIIDVAFVPSEIIPKVRLPWTLDVHPTKPWIMMAQGDHNVHMWNYETRNAKQISVKGKQVTTAKFIACDNSIMVGCSSGIIYVYSYDPEEKGLIEKDPVKKNPVKKIQVLKEHSESVNSLAVDATMQYVLSASQDHKILIWHYDKEWVLLRTIDAQTPVMHVAFNPKDSNVFASAQDKIVKIWDLHSDCCVHELSGHSALVVCLDYFSLGDRLYLITGSKDKTAKIWDCEAKSCIQTLKGHTDVVKMAYCHPDLPVLITGSWDGSVCLWGSTTFRLECTLNFDLGEVYAVASLKGSKRIALGSEKGLALIDADLEGKKDSDGESTAAIMGSKEVTEQILEEEIKVDQINLSFPIAQMVSSISASKIVYKVQSASTLDFHPTKPWMVITQPKKFVHIWDNNAKEVKLTIDIKGAKVSLAKFLAHQQIWVIAATTSGLIYVYDYDSREEKRVLRKHSRSIKSLAIHGTEPLVLSASVDGKILLWDYAEDWCLIKTFDAKCQCLTQVAFDPKDTNMFASAQDKTVKIWDRRRDKCQLTLAGHSDQVEYLDYFSGGEDKPYMITGSRDKTAKIWDCKNGNCVQTLEGHAGPVTIVCCHPNASMLITGCRNNGSIRLWNSTGDFRLERELNFNLGYLSSLACLKGSRRVAIGYERGLVLGTQ